jgi:hypothetical protein
MRCKFALIIYSVSLTACTNQPPVKSVHDVPIPPDLSSARDYDSEHNTSYETFAKQLMVSLLYWVFLNLDSMLSFLFCLIALSMKVQTLN